MYLAKVIGNIVATNKNENLRGQNLLIVQPVDEKGSATGSPVVALDWMNAGDGEMVFVVKGREAVYNESMKVMIPADAGIFGIVDSVDDGLNNLYNKGDEID